MAIRTSWVGLAAVVFAALAIVVFAAGESQARPLYTQWLGIDSLTMKIGQPLPEGKESFTMTGTFNVEPNSIESTSADLTLSVGTWSVNFGPSSWTCKGHSKTCKAKSIDGSVTASIQYWINGTSKCKYTFTAKKQDLRSHLDYGGGDYVEIPVELQIGTGFDETVIAQCNVKGSTVRCAWLGPMPHFILDKLQVVTSKAASRDTIVVRARSNIDFDPSLNGYEINVCGETVQIFPDDPWTLHGRIASIRKTFDGTKKLAYTINIETGKFTFTLSKLDLTTVDNPLILTFTLTGPGAASWPCEVRVSTNKKGTVYSY